MTIRSPFILLVILLSGCISAGTGNNGNNIEKQLQETRILFAGDVMLDWGIKDTITKEGIEYPLKNLKDFLQTFDYRFCNLECPVSVSGDVHPGKKYVFLGNPRDIALLKYSGINAVSLANNHACDYGKTALLNTIENLNKNRIETSGAGKDISIARLPLTISIKGIKIAMLSYASIAYEDSYAGKNTPGIAQAEIAGIKDDVKQYKAYHDYVVVSIHWGIEYSEYPAEGDVNLAHSIIDSGADAIVGHHPHIFQGIEIYAGKPIFYSLGNFIFGSKNEDAGENILVSIAFLKKKIKSIQVYPINGNGNSVSPFQYKLLSGESANKALNHLIDISNHLDPEFSQGAKIEEGSLIYNF